jgi:hypothetical protein
VRYRNEGDNKEEEMMKLSGFDGEAAGLGYIYIYIYIYMKGLSATVSLAN